MYIFSLNESKGYEEISKNGCIHSNGLQLRSCYRIIESYNPNECESRCTFESKWCVGYQIRKDDEDNFECELFPSNDTFTLCPEGWTYRHNENLKMAQTVFDLIDDEYGDYSYTCFGNITSKNLFNFRNSKKPILL